jgi:hypothetical protein
LAAVARLIPDPKEGTAALVNGFNNTDGEKSCAHSMGEHGGEDGVDEDKAPTNSRGSFVILGRGFSIMEHTSPTHLGTKKIKKAF